MEAEVAHSGRSGEDDAIDDRVKEGLSSAFAGESLDKTTVHTNAQM